MDFRLALAAAATSLCNFAARTSHLNAHDAAEEVDEKAGQEGDRKEGREALFCVNRGSQSSLKVEIVDPTFKI